MCITKLVIINNNIMKAINRLLLVFGLIALSLCFTVRQTQDPVARVIKKQLEK